MDNNNPQDPNSNNPFPASPASPATDLGTATPAANPWDTSSTTTPASTTASPVPESPWGAPASTPPTDPSTLMGGAPAPTDPMAATPLPADPTTPMTPNPMEANPFLQSQDTAQPGLEHPGGVGQPPADSGANPFGQPAAPTDAPNPMGGMPADSMGAAPTQDPLNTAFAPTTAPAENNPFGQPAAPTDAPNPMGGMPADSMGTSGTALPADPMTPAPVDPMTANPMGGATSGMSETPQDTTVGASAASGTLDLSSLPPGAAAQNPMDATPAAPTTSEGAAIPAAASPLPEMGPQENAPTDLSHLIAGDEAQQPTSGVYTPPLAPDQPPPITPGTPTTPGDGEAPPPGKHLNLTKVLLVVGIPIILIVAALSAYLILGVGKTQPQTSLPVEQTTSTNQQAPLTNPPQQIVAPSPVLLPSSPPATPSGMLGPSATSSPTSALDALRARSGQSSASGSLPQ